MPLRPAYMPTLARECQHSSVQSPVEAENHLNRVMFGFRVKGLEGCWGILRFLIPTLDPTVTVHLTGALGIGATLHSLSHSLEIPNKLKIVLASFVLSIPY